MQNVYLRWLYCLFIKLLLYRSLCLKFKPLQFLYYQIPPPIQTINVDKCGVTKGCYRIPEGCIEIECEYIFTWLVLGNKMEFEMSAITDGFNDRYFAVGLSQDKYMVSTVQPQVKDHLNYKTIHILIPLFACQRTHLYWYIISKLLKLW